MKNICVKSFHSYGKIQKSRRFYRHMEENPAKGTVRFEARYILSAQRFTYLALKFEIFQIREAHLAKVWRFEYANGGNVAVHVVRYVKIQDTSE